MFGRQTLGLLLIPAAPMSDSIRCFIAARIPPSNSLRRALTDLAEMGRAVKPVAAEQLHLTLKFLGQTDRDAVGSIERALRAAVDGKAACQVDVVGLGAFPGADRPNVVWAGLQGAGAKMLIGLAGELETRLEPLGFARERRPFVPHLTLARVKAKPPPSLGELLKRQASTAFGTATIESIELMQSETMPEGPLYSVLAGVPLERS